MSVYDVGSVLVAGGISRVHIESKGLECTVLWLLKERNMINQRIVV